ncbi:Transcriptional regulator, AraC family protein [Minicystis rosea]|nr:Transcriptional regulator, AraC family protein [Minicystis rosea]
MSTPPLRIAPQAALARFVRGLSVLTPSITPRQGEGGYVKLPDGEVDLVVRVTRTGGDAYVIGTRLQPLHKTGADVPPGTIAVRFRAAGAYPFFGVPMSELTDRVVSLDRLWGDGGARLRDALLTTTDVRARMEIVERSLCDRLRRGDVFEPSSALLVRRAVRAIVDAPTPLRVEPLARTLGVSTRQLRRSFDDVVGIGPKAFARVVRFQRAVEAAERGAAPDWGAIALAVGYCDQAHLVNDFRALSGVTPSALASARAMKMRPEASARARAMRGSSLR